MSGKENRIFTERAHLMCPRMCFGIVMSIDSAFETGRLQKTFGQAARNHPFLRAVLGYDEADNSYYYDVTESSMADLRMSEDELTGVDDPKLIRSPVVRNGKLATVGYCPEIWQNWE